MKKACALLVVLVMVTGALFASGEKEGTGYPWEPAGTVQLIVPWGAGGSTDRSARTTAGEIEDDLGTTIAVVNQAGASGSVGTQAALQAERDGTTWTAGAVKDLGVYKVQGLLDTTLDDWHLYLNFAMPNVIAVNPDTPYQDFGDLLEAFESNPGQIPVATAGVNSAGHTAMELLKKYTGIEYKHVTFGGGNPAVVATVGGETEVVPQLSVEEVDMIRGGRLRPLAVMADKPLEISGYDESIPPITNWVEDFEAAPIYFGIFIPKGVPEEVVTTMNQIWEDVVIDNETLQTWAQENAVIFDPAYGEEAVEKSFPMVQIDAWLKWDTGDAEVNPSEVGIPRPE